MPQSIVYLDDKENKIVESKAELWNLSKADTIKKIIRDFKLEFKMEGF